MDASLPMDATSSAADEVDATKVISKKKGKSKSKSKKKSAANSDASSLADAPAQPLQLRSGTINFHIDNGPVFSRLTEDVSDTASIREIICRKLGLPLDSKLHLAYASHGAMIELEDEGDFAAFERRTSQMKLADEIDVYAVPPATYTHKSAFSRAALAPTAEAMNKKRKSYADAPLDISVPGTMAQPSNTKKRKSAANMAADTTLGDDGGSRATSDVSAIEGEGERAEKVKRRRRTKAEMQAFRAEQAAKKTGGISSAATLMGRDDNSGAAEGTESGSSSDSSIAPKQTASAKGKGTAPSIADQSSHEEKDDGDETQEESTLTPRKKLALCGICSDEPYHVPEWCSIVKQGKKAMQKRLSELKALKQAKKAPERQAQKDLKIIIKQAVQ
ncbi:hypothetical protein K437DRAFT_256422 [Tilletiaria anomala UBC 951]|uniref:Uncharacterized protein n=1 Tax=Tilletiaria anomala (strain ATCC 24038 / CBS 436.72 / UBC 951) TaxID=1037660 RepID=A0A066W566_TILAU|nr:uncharacterized protein K437DRAFT_256422 [Tilletiaria anomala UBC 951]KDN45900.1 hypothetical protein K437DRAFT_256422 [Tilletiaria anomala UBC 951]